MNPLQAFSTAPDAESDVAPHPSTGRANGAASRRTSGRRAATTRIALLVALAAFYAAAASTHAARINTSKARGDQSGYLYDAEVLYHNWHGGMPSRLVDRNRMPLYGACLALFYDPAMSDEAFFALGKKLNIGLSIALLAALGVVFAHFAPPIVWMNLTIFVGFGYFVFKAGYVQSELLFYFLFFLAFLACCSLFTRRRALPTLGLAVVSGALLGLAHLTKAAMLPFVGVFLVAYFGDQAGCALARWRRGEQASGSGTERIARFAAGLLVVVAFLAVLSPYLLHSHRVFGHYFYNVNSTFYVWYDDWPQASVGTYRHGDHVGWPQMPASELPSLARYWREHSAGQIASRLAEGFEDMIVRSYQTFWFLKYLCLFFALTAVLVASHLRAFADLVRTHAGLFAFLVLYAGTYLFATAFYNATSGTGTARFLLAHVAPAAFVLSRFSTRSPFAGTSATLAGVTVTTAHVHLFVSALLGMDIAFTIWPRLMTTYGGF
jgi:hypothetical protein